MRPYIASNPFFIQYVDQNNNNTKDQYNNNTKDQKNNNDAAPRVKQGSTEAKYQRTRK